MKSRGNVWRFCHKYQQNGRFRQQQHPKGIIRSRCSPGRGCPADETKLVAKFMRFPSGCRRHSPVILVVVSTIRCTIRRTHQSKRQPNLVRNVPRNWQYRFPPRSHGRGGLFEVVFVSPRSVQNRRELRREHALADCTGGLQQRGGVGVGGSTGWRRTVAFQVRGGQPGVHHHSPCRFRPSPLFAVTSDVLRCIFLLYCTTLYVPVLCCDSCTASPPAPAGMNSASPSCSPPAWPAPPTPSRTSASGPKSCLPPPPPTR